MGTCTCGCESTYKYGRNWCSQSVRDENKSMRGVGTYAATVKNNNHWFLNTILLCIFFFFGFSFYPIIFIFVACASIIGLLLWRNSIRKKKEKEKKEKENKEKEKEKKYA